MKAKREIGSKNEAKRKKYIRSYKSVISKKRKVVEEPEIVVLDEP